MASPLLAKDARNGAPRCGPPRPETHKGSSHITLRRAGCANFVWAFHDRVEIGPKMLAQISKHTGLRVEDL